MPVVENDETKLTAQPFVIIAQVRAGGTFLAHCLSTHPDVACDRGESLHRLSAWRQQAPALEAGTLLRVLMHQEGYLASGCRCVYSQALHPEIWATIVTQQPLVIHLTRENVLRQAASLAVHRLIRKGALAYSPVHTFTRAAERAVPRYTLDPDVIVATCREMVGTDAEVRERLGNTGLHVLPMTYAEITGGEGLTRTQMAPAAAARVCDFLGVEMRPLTTRLTRVHGYPLRAMFENWDAIAAAIAGSEFGGWLVDEVGWAETGGGWGYEEERA